MTTTDTAATASIEAAARELKLPVVRASAARLAADAKRSKLSYLGFLAEILEAEVDARSDRRRTRRILDAKFPRMKRLADFDLDAAPTIEPAVIRHRQEPPPHRTRTRRLRSRPTRPLHHRRATRERTRRSRRRTPTLPHRCPLRPTRPALPRRTRLRPTRHTRIRTPVPNPHRTRREILHRARVQPAIQRMGTSHPRPPPRRRHRRPRHLQRPHHRNRHPVLPTQINPPTPNTWGQNKRAHRGQSRLTFPFPSMISAAPVVS